MTIRTTIGLLAAAFGAAAIQTPAAATEPQPPSATQQCRWEAPAQVGGPRAPVRPAQWTCAPATRVQKACGHYELYWPHWLSQRALPPLRRWVPERC